MTCAPLRGVNDVVISGTPSLPDVVFSLTDSRNVYVWDTKTQPARDVVDGAQPSTPTLTYVSGEYVTPLAIGQVQSD